MLRHWPEGQEIAKRHLLICLALEIVLSLDVDTDLPPLFYCLITASSDVIAPVSCEDEVLLILLPLLLLSLHSCIIAAAVFLLFWILLLPHFEPIWRCLHLRKKNKIRSHSDRILIVHPSTGFAEIHFRGASRQNNRRTSMLEWRTSSRRWNSRCPVIRFRSGTRDAKNA